jgi:hypothetical protein
MNKQDLKGLENVLETTKWVQLLENKFRLDIAVDALTYMWKNRRCICIVVMLHK